jgi:hypothetical protein
MSIPAHKSTSSIPSGSDPSESFGPWVQTSDLRYRKTCIVEGHVVKRISFADQAVPPLYEKVLQQKWSSQGTKGTWLSDWRDVGEVECLKE